MELKKDCVAGLLLRSFCQSPKKPGGENLSNHSCLCTPISLKTKL